MPQPTRFRDRYGLTLTTNSMTAVEGYVQGLDQFLAAERGADTFLVQAIEADEGFAAAYASLAIIQQFQGSAAAAEQSAARARTCMAGISERERRYVEVIAMFLNGGGSRVLPAVHAYV